MTKEEILAKIAQHQTSDAPRDVIDAAIKKLEAKLPERFIKLRRQILDGESDKDSADHLY